VLECYAMMSSKHPQHIEQALGLLLDMANDVRHARAHTHTRTRIHSLSHTLSLLPSSTLVLTIYPRQASASLSSPACHLLRLPPLPFLHDSRLRAGPAVIPAVSFLAPDARSS
jgi:hypothetical protein